MQNLGCIQSPATGSMSSVNLGRQTQQSAASASVVGGFGKDFDPYARKNHGYTLVETFWEDHVRDRSEVGLLAELLFAVVEWQQRDRVERPRELKLQSLTQGRLGHSLILRKRLVAMETHGTGWAPEGQVHQS